MTSHLFSPAREPSLPEKTTDSDISDSDEPPLSGASSDDEHAVSIAAAVQFSSPYFTS